VLKVYFGLGSVLNFAPSLVTRTEQNENHLPMCRIKKQFIMNALRNKVQLIGHLGTDVELKTLENGNCVARISLATNESYKNKAGEKVENTTWHNVVAWGKTAELANQLLKKGSEVALEGKLSNRSYEDKEGVKRYVSEVVMNEFLLVGKKEKAAAAPF